QVTAGENRARVIVAGGNRLDRLAHVDVARRGGRLVVADVAGVRIAELPVLREPPTAHVVLVEQGARVRGAGGNADHLASDVHVAHGRRVFVVSDVVDVAVAELAECARAPTAQRSALDDRTRVIPSHGDVHG